MAFAAAAVAEFRVAERPSSAEEMLVCALVTRSAMAALRCAVLSFSCCWKSLKGASRGACRGEGGEGEGEGVGEPDAEGVGE